MAPSRFTSEGGENPSGGYGERGGSAPRGAGLPIELLELLDFWLFSFGRVSGLRVSPGGLFDARPWTRSERRRSRPSPAGRGLQRH